MLLGILKAPSLLKPSLLKRCCVCIDHSFFISALVFMTTTTTTNVSYQMSLRLLHFILITHTHTTVKKCFYFCLFHNSLVSKVAFCSLCFCFCFVSLPPDTIFLSLSVSHLSCLPSWLLLPMVSCFKRSWRVPQLSFMCYFPGLWPLSMAAQRLKRLRKGIPEQPSLPPWPTKVSPAAKAWL